MTDKYIIYNWLSPRQVWQSGGHRALLGIRDEIRSRGYQCFFQYEQEDADAIYLYPEISYEESIHCKSNKVAYFFGNKEAKPRIPQDALSFVWHKAIRDTHLLNVNIFEMDLWKPSNNKSKQVAWWTGKGMEDLSLLPRNAIEITRGNFTFRAELAQFVSELDYLISFDPFTAVVHEAILAGTPVLIYNLGSHPSQPTWTKEEVTANEWLKYGVAWSLDELPEARDNVHLAREHYEEIMKTFPATIDNFIKVTQERAW